MTTELRDDVLLEGGGVVGPIELKFVGRWARVDDALHGLEHGPVRYRWSTDSTGDLALLIEIPVKGDPGAEQLRKYRGRLRESLNEVGGDRPVYIHFISNETLARADA